MSYGVMLSVGRVCRDAFPPDDLVTPFMAGHTYIGDVFQARHRVELAGT